MAITRRLICLLTELDILERGKELAKSEHDWSEREAVRKTENDAHKKALAAIEGRISELAYAIRDHQEERDVECVIDEDWAVMKKFLRRTDTGDVVETYEFTEKERQKSLIV